MNKLSGMLLAVLLLVVANAWAACTTTKKDDAFNCTGNPALSCRYENGGGQIYFGCYTTDFGGVYAHQSFACYTSQNCVISVGLSGVSCVATVTTCSSQCDVDSLQCINNGGRWTNTGASTCDGKSCKFSNCLQSDTLWLNDSKAACDAIGGENNYAITDIDETCVHSGICCPPDSALVGNTCKWRCDSLYTACNAKNGYLYAGVLQDTTISGSDSTFTNKCYYNCSYAYNKDSTTSVTDGNTACSSPSTPIADCTRMPNDFSSVRTTYGDSVYSYDFLTPGSAAYIDSIVLTPCSRFMYRCTVNGKYKYWYSDADIPTGCTNIVKIK